MKRSGLLNLLWEFQNDFGYIPDNTISEIAQKLKVSKIEIEGVVSFYHFFHRQPTGKYIVYLNNSIISEFKGFAEIKTAFEKETGCVFGSYENNSMFSLFETSCIGLSDQEPAVLINFKPFTNLTPKKVATIINKLKLGANLNSIADDPTSKIQFTPPEDKTIFFRHYEQGKSLQIMKKLTPDQILEEIKTSKLSGRGGAFYPTSEKWRSCKDNLSKKKYIICNADEGEPGTFKDRSLITYHPGLIIEGMIISAFVCKAKKGFIYLRAEYKYLLKTLEKTLKNFRNRNFLGKNILGIKNFDFDIKIQLGAGAYVCGAETALIESLEGNRGESRIRNYFPTEYGYKGYSTVVNNVETFAMASRILELGSNFILKIGTDKSKGTILLSIAGDVAKPGIYEVEYGTKIRDLLSLEMCQATAPNYIQLTGPSGECINQSEFDRKICKEDLSFGGSVMVFNRKRSILQLLENYANFFKTESCGNCTPCRVGNQILLEKIIKIKKGIGTGTDLQEIKDWSKIMKLTSRCGLGQYSANTFAMAIDKFEDYFNLQVTSNADDSNVEFDMEAAVFDYEYLINSTQK